MPADCVKYLVLPASWATADGASHGDTAAVNPLTSPPFSTRGLLVRNFCCEKLTALLVIRKQKNGPRERKQSASNNGLWDGGGAAFGRGLSIHGGTNTE